MKAVITVLGRDTVGILSKISGACADCNVNIEEVSQNILGGTFAMIMVVDTSHCNVEFGQLQQTLSAAGAEKGVEVKTTRQELYEAMHHI